MLDRKVSSTHVLIVNSSVKAVLLGLFCVYYNDIGWFLLVASLLSLWITDCFVCIQVPDHRGATQQWSHGAFLIRCFKLILVDIRE